MQSFHYWHARFIAVLAIVLFSSARPAYPAEPVAQGADKSAKAAEAPAAPGCRSGRPSGVRQAGRHGSVPSTEPARRRHGRSSRSGGPRSTAEATSQHSNGQQSPPSWQGGSVAAPPQPTPPVAEKPAAGFLQGLFRGNIQPSPPEAVEPAPAAAVKKVEKLRFQFRFQPWKDVLDWFAQQADLSLVIGCAALGHVQL